MRPHRATPSPLGNTLGPNPYRTTTLKEMLLIVALLAISSATFARGREFDMKLAMTICASCAFMVSVFSKADFRHHYLAAFVVLLPLGWFDYSYSALLSPVYYGIRNACFDRGYDKYRIVIFYSILLVILPYLYARFCVMFPRSRASVDASTSPNADHLPD